MTKRTRINATIATALAVCAIAASVPATSYAQTGHGAAAPATVEPGGGGH